MKNQTVDSSLLSGKNERNLVKVPEWQCQLHVDVVEPLKKLIDAAAKAGFEMTIASGFRGFERQCLIWNEKITGRRPLLDAEGSALNVDTLSDWEKIQAVLHWSALPGASRHHWGTEVDVFDNSAIDENYCLQLTVEETLEDGVFAEFYCWLNEKFAGGQYFGFFRPYCDDQPKPSTPLGADTQRCVIGVAREPWHLSYAATALHYQQSLTIDVLEEVVSESNILLRDVVLEHLEEIFRNYVLVDLNKYPSSIVQ